LETCLETKCPLLPPLLNSTILAHIFNHLPLTPSMFWWLRQINKPWFLIMGENVHWNTLEVVRINHKSYLQHVATSHTPRQSLKMWFEGELWTLQKFIEPWNLVEHTLLSSSFASENSIYSSTHILVDPWCIPPIIFVTWDQMPNFLFNSSCNISHHAWNFYL
jgi:hypothetical protein